MSVGIMTYEEALATLCDNYDAFISPKKLRRSNTNGLYLVFKAIAKSWEVINNAVYALYNKFNVSLCDEDDLESIAFLVQTERKSATYSGLRVTFINSNTNAKTDYTLKAGTYEYRYNSDYTFVATIAEDVTLAYMGAYTVLFMANNTGQVAVDENLSINLVYYELGSDVEKELDNSIWNVSCKNNADLLGRDKESLEAFRERIRLDNTRLNPYVRLEQALEDLPYIIDARVIFNNNPNTVYYGDYPVLPYAMYIAINGNVRNEIAEVVASYTANRTCEGYNAQSVTYKTDNFALGFKIWVNEFQQLKYTIHLQIVVDNRYLSSDMAQAKLSLLLTQAFVQPRKVSILNQQDVYEVLNNNKINGITIAGVKFINSAGEEQDYISVPATHLAVLDKITYREVV